MMRINNVHSIKNSLNLIVFYLLITGMIFNPVLSQDFQSTYDRFYNFNIGDEANYKIKDLFDSNDNPFTMSTITLNAKLNVENISKNPLTTSTEITL